jgi:DNA adenine methylase
MKPIVRWAGGKRRALPELLRRVPKGYGRYFEPFLGAGTLFFALAESGRPAVLGDANADLIEMYRALAWNVGDVCDHLEELCSRHNRDHYLAVRSTWNDRPVYSPAVRAAQFLYLNQSCYAGLWRVNRRGEFNVAFQPDRKPQFGREAMTAAAAKLQRTILRAGSYEETVSAAVWGDFAYLDPPYVPLSPTANFTSYTAGGFGLRAQHELAATVLDLAASGVHVMVSQSDTPLVRDLYADLRIEKISVRRSIGKNKGGVYEVLITSEGCAI